MKLIYIILVAGSKDYVFGSSPRRGEPLTYLVQTWADFGGWACLTLKTFFSKNRTIVSIVNAKIPKKIITLLAIIRSA